MTAEHSDAGPFVDRLPEPAVATAPPEARGVARDAVRMLVASAHAGLEHRRAYHLSAALRPGDLLVLNTSDTLPAALRGVTGAGERVAVHLSTPDPAGPATPAAALAATGSRWVVELRRPSARFGGDAAFDDRSGTEVHLAGGGRLLVRGPAGAAPGGAGPAAGGAVRSRLWTAEVSTPAPLRGWLAEHGQPIRYGYVTAPWPLSAYRTTYADTPGSAEMPSAGRALTPRTFRRLRARGVRTAGLVLHCGVSSPDAGEPPQPEWYSVPQSTVDAAAATRRHGGRVVAVGTTVVRALETVAATGRRNGWSNHVVGPDRPSSTVDGLLTGWHPPEASHLQLLRGLADAELLRASYQAAAAGGYQWHEFGDLHLILP